MLLVKELAAACSDTNLLGCRVVEVCVMQPHLFINTDLLQLSP